MTPRDELLKASNFFADAVDDPCVDVEDAQFCAILRDWLLGEANRHVHLSGLDSGYDEVSVWQHPAMTAQTLAVQPCIRMARLVNALEEEDDGVAVPPLPEADR